MIDIRRSKGFLAVREMYFSSTLTVKASGEDLQYLVQSSAQGPGSALFYSSIVDLLQDEVELSAGMRKGFAYEIRRARERDGIVPILWTAPTVAQIESFCAFFDAFAQTKGLGTANRAKLLVLAESGSLVLSASAQLSSPEFWYSAHAYVCDGRRARLLYSGGNCALSDPEQRKVQGRANKLLHWEMIEFFKRQEYAEYDLGGISKSDALRALDDFKLGFGGREVLEYNHLIGITPLGKLTVLGLSMLRKLKSIRASRRT